MQPEFTRAARNAVIGKRNMYYIKILIRIVTKNKVLKCIENKALRLSKGTQFLVLEANNECCMCSADLNIKLTIGSTGKSIEAANSLAALTCTS